MSDTYILVVDDEPSVLEFATRDLAALEDFFPIDIASDAAMARQRIEEIKERRDRLGLILCDHLMPGENGVELLVWMQNQPFTRKTRKLLLTAHAGLDNTVKAVNFAGLSRYIAKPWNGEELQAAVRQELSYYVLACGLDPRPLLNALDPEIMGRAIHHGLLGDR